jgi:hypothetical protein
VQVLDFNSGIDFGAKGNLKEFSPAGFSSDSDEVSTWSEKPFVELTFRVPPLRRDLRLTIQVFPYVPDRTPVRKQAKRSPPPPLYFVWRRDRSRR